MKIIAIAMQKGGVGKSTLTRSLAVAGSAAGLNVLALDMDAQQSTSQWGKRRARGEAKPLAVRFTTEIELESQLRHAEKAGCDLVIIDTPPARSTEAPAAIEVADLVLVPCTPDIEAYEQLQRTARVAKGHERPAFVVLNMAQPNSPNEEKVARDLIGAMNLTVADAVLHRFKVHRDASREGVSAQEIEPDSKAALEIQALWDFVCARLQIGSPAHTLKTARKA
jgi:chromosome partitioning protein